MSRLPDEALCEASSVASIPILFPALTRGRRAHAKRFVARIGSSSLALILLASGLLAHWPAVGQAQTQTPEIQPEAVADSPETRTDDKRGTPSESDSEPGSASESSSSPPLPLGPPPPLGVRLAEALPAGAVRLAYRFERLQHRDVLVSGADRSPSEILTGFYQRSPVELDINRHVFSLAYAPHDRVTLVFEMPFLEKELQRIERSGAGFLRRQDQTDGIGDIAFSVIVPFIQKGHESSQLHISVEAPTGSIRRGARGEVGRLPYDSQIGNGTWDLEWGWTYRGELDRFSWGAQLFGQHPVGTNGLHYREGSRFEASAWSAARLFRGLSASVRLGATKQNNIRGRDRGLDLAADGPSSNDKARGGFRVEIYPGLSLDLPELNHQRVSVEFGVPIHQELDGPQLARDWSLRAGWQWMF